MRPNNSLLSRALLIAVTFVLFLGSAYAQQIGYQGSEDEASFGNGDRNQQSLGLFGRCPLFDEVVGDRMLNGKITADEAFTELDSQNCPIVRGANIKSGQQLSFAVKNELDQGRGPNQPQPQPQPSQSSSSYNRQQSQGLFGRCPLFDEVVGDRMLNGKITADEAFAELDSQNCPIVRGANIMSGQQLYWAVKNELERGRGPKRHQSMQPMQPMQPMQTASSNTKEQRQQSQQQSQLQQQHLGLFGRCPMFDEVVGNNMMNNKISPDEAFSELDSKDCPIVRSANIRSGEQLALAVDREIEQGHGPPSQPSTETHADHEMSEGCCRLDALAKQIQSRNGVKDNKWAKDVMDELVTVDCPSLVNSVAFSEIKNNYKNGSLPPSRALKQLLDRCPLFAPPTDSPKESGEQPPIAIADECRKLSDLLYSVDEKTASEDDAKRVIDELINTTCPIITNCPLFQRMKNDYVSNRATARESMETMKDNCPVLSRKLNPAMVFNYEEYGGHREAGYDRMCVGHCHAANPASVRRFPGEKRLFERSMKEDACVADGTGDCSQVHHFEKRSSPQPVKQRTSGLEKLIGYAFPKSSPVVSSLLATFYISLFPNLVLFATPSSIPQQALRIMVGFAVGGLLGDVFLHLLPHIFGAGHDHGHHDHAHDDNDALHNTVYGCTIFIGLMVFLVVDKFMRIFSNDGSHDHSHSHSHSHGHAQKQTPNTGHSTGYENKQNLRKRRGQNARATDENEADNEKYSHTGSTDDGIDTSAQCDSSARKPQIKLSAYLNLIADATHNFTDGLAIAASFYLSRAAGLSTFVAVFFHEIPHELGDFAILMQSGFSRASALASQFFTAIGAIAGTIAGILIEEAGRGNTLNTEGIFSYSKPLFVPAPAVDPAASSSILSSILGALPQSVAGVPWSKLVIPFTAGGFIYVGTVSVLPDLLQPSNDERHEVGACKTKNGSGADSDTESLVMKKNVKMALYELGAMLLGLGIMAVIALNED